MPIEAWWDRDDPLARVARGALRPLGALYGSAMAARNAWYDRRGGHRLAVPALSIGNLSVGGTGKTPLTAWAAARLAERGARPAVVLRGYGDDEPLVHGVLNPGVPVIVSADRLVGAERARAAGADLCVLDDAFQHRRAARIADVVLVGADTFRPWHRVVPAGPWRERPSGLRRATLVVVTRKAVPLSAAEVVARWVATVAPSVAIARVALLPDGLRAVGDPARTQPLSMLAGASVMATSGVGNPAAFEAQLEAAGARVTAHRFRDHHRYTAADVARLARAASSVRAAFVVTTLKDAVKLGPIWHPEAPPLWYVSQRVVVEDGHAALDRALADVLDARHPPAG